MLFESALQDMRLGASVTRDSWNNNFRIFFDNENIYMLDIEISVTYPWKPQLEDIQADDWLIDFS